MNKEIVICVVIIIAIVVANIFTQNYVTNSTEEIVTKLENLKGEILKLEEDKIDKEKIKEVEELRKNWEIKHDILAYFIEHDELEKVETDLTSFESYTKTAKYTEAISELDKAKFVLKHIEEKYALNLENIF